MPKYCKEVGLAARTKLNALLNLFEVVVGVAAVVVVAVVVVVVVAAVAADGCDGGVWRW